MEPFKKTIFHRPSVKKSSNEDVRSGHLTSVCKRTITPENPENGQSKLNVVPNHSWKSADSFCNFKIEIMNNNASTSRKRRLDDSCLDDTFETPDKNQYNLRKRISPDLSVKVSSDPLPKGHSDSSTIASEIVSPGGNILFGDKGQALPGLNSEQVDGGDGGLSEEWDCWKGDLVPSTLPGSDSESNPVFDCDVEDIMCLSPIQGDDSCSSEGLDGFLESCQNFNEDGDSYKKSDGQSKPIPCLSPLKKEATELGKEKEIKVKKKGVVEHQDDTAQQGRRLSDEGYFTRSYLHALRVGRDASNYKKDDGQSEPVPCLKPVKKEATVLGEEREIKIEKEKEGVVKNQEDTGEQEWCLSDEGYFTRSYLHARRAGKAVSKAATPALPQISSSPLVCRRGKATPMPASSPLLRAGTEEGEGPCPLEPNEGQAVCPERPVSFNLGDDSIHGAPLIPVETAGEGLEGTPGEVWVIGSPVLQSSLCHSDTDVSIVVCDEGSEGKNEWEGGVLRPAQECQDTLGAEETSYETTLPLQVQVRSVVVFPKDNGDSRKPPSPPFQPRDLQEVKRTSQSQHRRSRETAVPRPLVYDSEERWQHEKRLYVDKVTSHMMEQREEDVGVGHGVMTEWRNLMSRVADQRPGTKHSSDLTCRNYQERFGNENPGLTLDQWQNHSFKNHKRFAKVPLFFERSPIP